MSLTAYRCPEDHVFSPEHPRCPSCGRAVTESIELRDRTGTVVTWTTSTASPPGVREPNPIAIVEFDIEGTAVRVIGGLTTADVTIGDAVRPVYVPELRDPDEGLRLAESQSWDGYRFEPV